MNIDIIIPVYNAKSTIRRLLYSISYQKNSDKFKVYLFNDCDLLDYSEDINIFSSFLSITELKLDKNSGPGVARQHGLNNSNGDYVIFIDADDYFYNPYAIIDMYRTIEVNNADLLVSNFIYQRDNEILVKKNNMVWLHGKMYKRSFLNKYNIFFNNTRANEDNGFNRLILFCKPKIAYINEITYVYSENINSITRKNNREYKLYGLEGYSYNMCWAMKEALKRNLDSTYIYSFSLSCLISMYFYYLELYGQYDCNCIINWSVPIYNIFLVEREKFSKETISKRVDEHFDLDYKNKEINFIISFDEFLSLLEGEKL